MSQVSWLTLDKIKGKNMSLQMKKNQIFYYDLLSQLWNYLPLYMPRIKQLLARNASRRKEFTIDVIIAMVDAWKELRKTTWIKNETIKASFSDILSLRTDTCANMEGRGEGEGKGSKESLLAAASVSVYTLKKQWWLLFKVGAMGPRGWSTGCKSEILCAMRSIILICLLPNVETSRTSLPRQIVGPVVTWLD